MFLYILLFWQPDFNVYFQKKMDNFRIRRCEVRLEKMKLRDNFKISGMIVKFINYTIWFCTSLRTSEVFCLLGIEATFIYLSFWRVLNFKNDYCPVLTNFKFYSWNHSIFWISIEYEVKTFQQPKFPTLIQIHFLNLLSFFLSGTCYVKTHKKDFH